MRSPSWTVSAVPAGTPVFDEPGRTKVGVGVGVGVGVWVGLGVGVGVGVWVGVGVGVGVGLGVGVGATREVTAMSSTVMFIELVPPPK